MENVEIWKSIPDYPNYQVSNFGNIKSLNYNHTNKEKLLKQCKDKDGYNIIVLSINGKHKTFKVHRLVALVFLENPDNLPIINHKDENKQNNCVSNLEWCDCKYNNNYGTHNIQISEKYKGENNPFYGKYHTDEARKKISEAKRKPILQFTLDNVFMREWESAKKASEELNLFATSISRCLKNKQYSCGGFVWKYK